MIGVMVREPGEPGFQRCFFAVGQDDQAKDEWTAIDRAMLLGNVAESPVRGLEPVHTITQLTAQTVRVQALKTGEVRPLGRAWPRRWIGVERTPERDARL